MTAPGVAAVQKYKFQKLEVYQLALEYLDLLYLLSKKFPPEEKYNLTSQIQRAATSIVFEYFGRVDWAKRCRTKQISRSRHAILFRNRCLFGHSSTQIVFKH
jgi:hypothetical protein